MEVIEEIYEKIINNTDRDYSKDEFGDLIEDKINELGGLCDRETAAKLIARDLGINPEEKFVKVSEIEEDMDRVSFTAKVVDASETNTFDRDDGSVGRVVNLSLADDTGKVRVVLWDEDADLVKLGEIEEGDVLKIQRGRVKSGYSGLEVNLSNVSEVSLVEDDDFDFDVELEGRTPIGDLEEDMGSVHVFGEVLDVGDKREFENDDGGGQVRSVKIGDESGKINASLWGDHADIELEEGDRLKVEYGYTRERYGNVDLNVGYRGKLEVRDEGVSYNQNITSLVDVEENETYDVEGKVVGKEDIYCFERDDGSEGKVSNIYLNDGSDEKRVALWGEKADFVNDLEVGHRVLLEDVRAKENNGEVELSVGWNSNIKEVGDEKEKVEGCLSLVEGGERVEVCGTVISEDFINDGTGTIWIKEKLPSVGTRVEVVGDSFVENDKVFVEVEEMREADFGEEDVEEISSKLLEEIDD